MSYFQAEHQLFRESIRQFVEKEIVPNADKWEKEEKIPREIWRELGKMGFLGINYAEKYGGVAADFFYSVVFLEEISRSTIGGFAAAVSVHQYMAVAHIAKVGSEFLKQKYLVPAIKGEAIGALAITEPGGGSDVAGLRTSASKDGDNYIINGSKTFITNSVYGDFITVACRTQADSKGVDGISLIVVDRNTVGVSVNKLSKMGWHCSDTGEIFFDNVKVPQANLVGEEGKGFYYIMEGFQLERIVCGIMALAGCFHAIELTLKYISERETFGKKLKQYQVVRHRLVDLMTELEAAKHLVYYTCTQHAKGEYVAKEATMVKLLTTELGKKIADECLQFFGGYGFMNDFPISRMYRDARVATIVAGTSEIMREIIAKITIDEVSYRKNKQVSEESTENLLQTAKEIITSIPSRFRPEKATGIKMCVHFDIAGNKGGKFTVIIQDEKCSLLEGLQGNPTCLISAKDSDYADIELGRINPQVAFMTGKILVSNVSEMMQFTKLFRRLE